MPNAKFELEYAHLDDALKHVLADISGASSLFCLDKEPNRKYSVGILSPKIPDDVTTGKTTPSRRPTMIGFEAQITATSPTIALDLSVNFATYWRALPSFEEQLFEIPPNVGKNLSGETGKVRLRQKYMREVVAVGPVHVEIGDLPKTGVLEINAAQISEAVNTELALLTAKVTSEINCWPAETEELSLPISTLVDKKTYEDYLLANFVSKPKEKPEWLSEFSIKAWPAGKGTWRFAFLFSNAAEQNKLKHPSSLFSCEVSTKLANGKFVSTPYAAAALDYRYSTVGWGKGINCVLTVDADGQYANTDTAPVYLQPRTATRSDLDASCSFERLSKATYGEELASILSWLNGYVSEWKTKNAKYSSDASYTLRLSDLAAFEAEIERFKAGISALESDEKLRQSFRLANEAFSQGSHNGWRLFQLVFVVSQLPSLLAREKRSPELIKVLNRVDVLWFPTGGGKTEAYFGVIIAALFYDRLRGKKRGVTAWLRYPLRMLSIQQLQRLMEVIVAADTVRVKSEIKELSDGVPFALGYYVGSANTPNELTHPAAKAADQKIMEVKRRVEMAADSNDIQELVLQRCPFPQCKNDKLEIQVNVDEVRIKHFCPKCKNEIPIYISDSEIYRYTPSVIVGTVDRLARAGQTSRFGHIFGQADELCPKHGYVSFGQCVESAVCDVKEFESIEPIYDPTPALLLQDELHLLRESLGTYDSHFETFIDVLSAGIGIGLPPKRLAATATIEGYQSHIQELYQRDAVRFPVKGIGEFESAYVDRSTEAPIGRIYVGIMPTGADVNDLVESVLRSLSVYSQMKLVDPGKEKLTREILAKDYDLGLAYVNQKNVAGDLRSSWEDHEVQVLTGDRGLAEVRSAIGRVESDQDKPYEDRLKVLIATSVISHGVDLERLNFMAFAGMPASASDYIQASSRVGRSHVGIVFSIFKPNNLRERNIYQRFHEYHERLYQLVQPVPINRLSQSAISRTLTGILSACILNVLAYEIGKAYGGFDSGKNFSKAIRDGKVTDERMVELVRESLGVDAAELAGNSLTAIDELIRKLVATQRRMIDQDDESRYLTYRRMRPLPVSSLRDVSEQLGFRLTYKSGLIVGKLMAKRISG